jgi:hypothetical protein
MKKNKLNHIWDKISDDLNLSYTENNKEALYKAIQELPVYEAPEHMWLKIEKNLNPKTKIFRLSKSMLVAATVALIFGLSFFINKMASVESKVQYSKVNSNSNNLYNIADTSSTVFSKIITSSCEIKPTYCTSAEFKSFEKEYKDLELMQDKILKQANQYDNESDLELMLLKIENQKKNIEQYLIEQINS